MSSVTNIYHTNFIINFNNMSEIVGTGNNQNEKRILKNEYALRYYSEHKDEFKERNKNYYQHRKNMLATDPLMLAKKGIKSLLPALTYEQLFLVHNHLYGKGIIRELQPLGASRISLKKAVTRAYNIMNIEELADLRGAIGAVGVAKCAAIEGAGPKV